MALDDTVRCAKCGSTQIHAEKRGWSFSTGMVGAGKIVLTCLKSGGQFKPGGERRDEVSPGLAVVVIMIVVAVMIAILS